MDIIDKIFFKLFLINTIEYPITINKQSVATKITIKDKFLRILMCKLTYKYKDLDPELITAGIMEVSYITLQKIKDRYSKEQWQEILLDLDDYSLENTKDVTAYLRQSVINFFVDEYCTAEYKDGSRHYICVQCESLDSFEPKLRELLIHNATNVPQEMQNGFSLWFLKNKESLLTRKQLEYIEDPNTKDLDRHLRYLFRKRISNRIMKKYNFTFNNHDSKQIELLKKLNIIKNIIASSNPKVFSRHISYYLNHSDYISNLIYSYNLPTYVLKDLVKCTSINYYILHKTTLKAIYNLFTDEVEKINDKLNIDTHDAKIQHII